MIDSAIDAVINEMMPYFIGLLIFSGVLKIIAEIINDKKKKK